MADITIKYGLQGCDAIIAVSNCSADTLIKEFSLNKNKVFAVPVWIESDVIVNNDLIKKIYSLPVRLLFVGHVLPHKGIRQIIDLINYVHTNQLGEKYFFDIVGDSDHPIVDEVKKLANDYDFVCYYGRQYKPALWEYYKNADIFLMLSQWPEGGGNVIIEAYAHGTPVVGSNLGAIPEYVGKFRYYRIVDHYDPKQLLAVIDSLYVEIKNTGKEYVYQNCADTIKKKFSEDNFLAHKKVYQDLVQRLSVKK